MQIDAVGFFHAKKGGKRIDVARKNKRVYGTNIYQDWVNSGRLPEVLAFISECAKKLVSQKEMCQVLKINKDKSKHIFFNEKRLSNNSRNN